MRLIASLLLCACALTTGAAEIWRWKDAQGAWHYSDNPVPGAERIIVNAPAPSGSGEAAPGEALPDVPRPEPGPAPFAYRSCTVSSPAADETFFGVQAVSVRLAVEPEPQPGHRIQVLVNGTPRSDWPASATEYTFSEVFRGSHTLSVRIIDASGRTLCSGMPVTFHLRQNSVLPPAGQPARPAPGRPSAPPPRPPQPGG